MRSLTWAAVLLLAGCPAANDDDSAPGGDDDDDAWDPGYPLDDVLRLDHVQMTGTHNSYHVAPESDLVEGWNYTHAALDVQLGEQGVRQLELDLWRNADTGAFDVLHVPVVDAGTTCPTLIECLTVMKDWSDANPGHHAIFALIEPKDGVDEEDAAEYVAAIEAEVLAVWPRDRLVTPDDVRGEHATVREAVAADGWPTLGATRGKLVAQLHDGGTLGAAYSDDWTTSEGRALFSDPSADHPLAGFVTMNDPIGSFDGIAAAVAEGVIVRTRGDAGRSDFEDGDTARLDAALASGAHAVSTDHPTPDEETGYVVQMPGGTPSRCNPVTAPPECTPEAIEDPARLAP